MQNKPNFRKAKMNVTSSITMNYENKSNWTLGENKPNSNPIPQRDTRYAIRNTQYEIQTQFKNQTNAAAFDKLTKKRIISALVTQSAKQAVV